MRRRFQAQPSRASGAPLPCVIAMLVACLSGDCRPAEWYSHYVVIAGRVAALRYVSGCIAVPQHARIRCPRLNRYWAGMISTCLFLMNV